MTSLGFDPYYPGEDDDRDLEAEWDYFVEGDHEAESADTSDFGRHEEEGADEDALHWT